MKEIAKGLGNNDRDFAQVSTRLLNARNGMRTMKVFVEGRELFLHSSYDPQREAEKWAERVAPGEEDVIAVFGLGLGYHVQELVRKFPENKIVVFEARKEFVKEALKCSELRTLVENNQVILFEGDESKLQELLVEQIGFQNLDRIRFADWRHALDFDKKYYDDLKKLITQLIGQLLIEMNTILFFSDKWLKNMLNNLPSIIKSPGVNNLYGKFVGKPAVIVSAGPSLNDNIHLLKRAKGKSVIICVGAALKPMLQNGIKPDLVLSIDGGAPNNRYFQNLTAEDVPLIFDITIYPEIARNYRGPKFVGSCMEDLLSWVNNLVGQEKGLYDMGPSVANVALSLAVNFGCNPVILVGQDLAYKDGKYHAKGTAYDHITKEHFKGKDILEIEGIDGSPVTTDRVMLTFLHWFEKKITSLNGKLKVIDATEGGARIPGTTIMDLASALKEHCREDIGVQQIISRALEDFASLDKQGLEVIIDEIKDLEKRLHKVSEVAARGREESKRLLGWYQKGGQQSTKVNKILTRLDKVDKEFYMLKETLDLFGLVFQHTILRVNSKLKQKVKGESEVEKGQRIALASMELYDGIARRGSEIQKAVGTAAIQLENLLG